MLQRRRGARPFSVPGYPVIAVVFIIVTPLILGNTLHTAPMQTVAGICVMVLCLSFQCVLAAGKSRCVILIASSVNGFWASDSRFDFQRSYEIGACSVWLRCFAFAGFPPHRLRLREWGDGLRGGTVWRGEGCCVWQLFGPGSFVPNTSHHLIE